MSIRYAVIVMTLNLGVAVFPMAHALAAGEAASDSMHKPTPEQTEWVKSSVQQLRAAGLPPALQQQPTGLAGRTEIMVSDAISVVELAHVDFNRGTYFFSVSNPWTATTHWYGEFALAQP